MSKTDHHDDDNGRGSHDDHDDHGIKCSDCFELLLHNRCTVWWFDESNLGSNINNKVRDKGEVCLFCTNV